MDGTRLLRRAIKASRSTQKGFARRILRVSHRTLTRMLSGEREIRPTELYAIRLYLKTVSDA
jgi:hypothetical protein